MTGYNSSRIRHAWYGGREYWVLADGTSRLVWSFCGCSHAHCERGHAS